MASTQVTNSLLCAPASECLFSIDGFLLTKCRVHKVVETKMDFLGVFKDLNCFYWTKVSYQHEIHKK